MQIKHATFVQGVRLPSADKGSNRLRRDVSSEEYDIKQDELGWLWVSLEGADVAVMVPPSNVACLEVEDG